MGTQIEKMQVLKSGLRLLKNNQILPMPVFWIWENLLWLW